MARRTDGGVRFRPVGSSRHPRTPVRYSPGGTGCPAIEQAIERLYHGQNEESFWALMGALNYALELETHVLVPLRTALTVHNTPAPWTEHPVPTAKAKDLQRYQNMGLHFQCIVQSAHQRPEAFFVLAFI